MATLDNNAMNNYNMLHICEILAGLRARIVKSDVIGKEATRHAKEAYDWIAKAHGLDNYVRFMVKSTRVPLTNNESE